MQQSIDNCFPAIVSTASGDFLFYDREKGVCTKSLKTRCSWHCPSRTQFAIPIIVVMTMVLSGAATAAATTTIATCIQAELLPIGFPVSLRRLDLLLCACDFRRFLGCGVHIVAHLRDGGDSIGWHRRSDQS